MIKNAREDRSLVSHVCSILYMVWRRLRGKMDPIQRAQKKKLKTDINYAALFEEMYEYALTKEMPVLILNSALYHEMARLYDFAQCVSPMTDNGAEVGYYKGIPVVVNERVTTRPGYYEVIQ